MPTIELPLTAAERARVPEMVKEVQATPLGAGSRINDETILRMVFSGGVHRNKERTTANALEAPADVEPMPAIAVPSDVAELDALAKAWSLGRDEALRIIVVDGFVCLEEQLLEAKPGHRQTPAKGSA